MESQFIAYFIVPLYNLSFDVNTKSLDLDGGTIYTSKDFHSTFNKDDFFNSENLYEDITLPYSGLLITRPWADHVYVKKISLFKFISSESFQKANEENDKIIKELTESFMFFIIASRLYKAGNIQINSCYVLSKEMHYKYGIELSTYLEGVTNFFSNPHNFCLFDKYALSETDARYIFEKKEKIKKAYEKIGLPINYFMSYYKTSAPSDKIIRLCTIWETTLLNDRTSELNYCLKIRGSFFLQKNLKQIFDSAYDIRSKLLHSGIFPEEKVKKLKNIVKLPNYAKEDSFSYLFYFIKDCLEPLTRDILNKFIDKHIETEKNLEEIAQGIDNDMLESFSKE